MEECVEEAVTQYRSHLAGVLATYPLYSLTYSSEGVNPGINSGTHLMLPVHGPTHLQFAICCPLFAGSATCGWVIPAVRVCIQVCVHIHSLHSWVLVHVRHEQTLVRGSQFVVLGCEPETNGW